MLLADQVLLDAEIPADVVKDQLQRPHPPFARAIADGGAVVATGTGETLEQQPAPLGNGPLDCLGATGCRQRLTPHQGGVDHPMAGIEPQGRGGLIEARPGQALLQFGEQGLGRGICQAAGGLLHQGPDLPQPRRRQHGGAEGIPMAHVVVGGAEAVGGEEFFEVLAQGGGLAGQVAAGDGGGGGDQLLMEREGAGRIAIEGVVQQVAQQGHHPLEHRPITHRWVAAVDAAPVARWAGVIAAGGAGGRFTAGCVIRGDGF